MIERIPIIQVAQSSTLFVRSRTRAVDRSPQLLVLLQYTLVYFHYLSVGNTLREIRFHSCSTIASTSNEVALFAIVRADKATPSVLLIELYVTRIEG
jgi:hypothetical protein